MKEAILIMKKQKLSIKILMAVLGILLLLTPLAGCAAEEEVAPAAEEEVTKYGGTLRIATTADTKTLDPALLITNGDIWLTDQTYDKLIETREDLTLKPELAVSWEPNEDITSYTVHLRQGVKFHSGKEFTSEDVVFTFERLLDPEVASPGRSELSSIKDIITVDKHTVRFDLNAPNSFFPNSLTIYQAKILPSNIDTSKLTTQTDGTGPFILEEFIVGQRAILKRNPDYWDKGKPYLDEVIFFYMPGAESRIEALKTGSVDVVTPLSATEALGLEEAPGVKISEVASPSYLNFIMDVTQEPFTKKKVRQAFQAATDREAILKTACLGRGAIGADVPICQTDPYFSAEMKVPAYDTERARQLLEEAGYPDGIEVTLHTCDVMPGQMEMAVAFKESAAPAGIVVNIQRDPEEIYWSKIWLNTAFMTCNWFGRTPDGALSVVMLSDAPWNESHYQNPVLDELIMKARGQADFESQKQTYLEIYNILVEDVPRIIPVFTPVLLGMRDNVNGLSAHAGRWLLLEYTWLER
jgi:peptide/nickel transport system substrate-binding protein